MKATPQTTAKARKTSTKAESANETLSAGETIIGCDKLIPLQEIPEGFSLPAAVLAFEARYISFALQSNAGSVTKAAKLLGISHQNLSLQLTQRHQPLRAIKKQRAQRRDFAKG